MNKKKNKIDNIKKYIPIIVILLLFFYSAKSTKYLAYIPKSTIVQYIIIGILTTVILIKSFIKKEKIFFSNLDFAVLGLSLSSLIPIVYNHAISLEKSLETVNIYVIIFEFYIFIKYVLLNRTELKKYLINIIIIVSVFFVFVGIDKMTFNLLKNVNTEFKRLESIFYSANALAVVLGASIFLCLGILIRVREKRIRIIYISILSLLMLSFILTYSRFMYAIFFIAMFIYFLVNNDKYVRKNIIISVFVSIICGFIYSIFYEKMLILGMYYKIWIGLFIEVILSTIVILVVEKIKCNKIVINKKIIWIFLASLGIVVCLYIIIAFRISSPLRLVNLESVNYKMDKPLLYNAKKNYNYKVEFNISSKGKEDNTFKIVIVERNKYMDYITGHVIEFGTFEGEKNVEFITSSSTTSLHLEIYDNEISNSAYISINSIKLNGKEKIINYRFLPTSLIERFGSGIFNSKNLLERITFYKDALKIIKDDYNWLFGIGGNCWRYKYTEYQEYYYTSYEVHNYLLQIFLEFGISGLIFLIIIVYIVIKNLIISIKEKDFMQISLVFAFLCIFAHSCFDYDMAYIYIMLVVWLLLAMISTKDVKVQYKSNVAVKIIFLILVLVTLFFDCFYLNYIKKNGTRTLNISVVEKVLPTSITVKKNIIDDSYNVEEVIDSYIWLLKNEPYNYALNGYCRYPLDYYIELIIKEKSDYEIVESLEVVNDYLNKTTMFGKFNVNYQLYRLEMILKVCNIIESYDSTNENVSEAKNNLYKTLINEIESKKQYILDSENCRYDNDNIENYENRLNRIYNIAIKNQNL